MPGSITGRTLPAPADRGRAGFVNGPFTRRSRDRNFAQFADVDIRPMPARQRARAPGSRAGRIASLEDSRKRLEHRIGLNVPYEWWPGAATLKAIEAAGFRWVQVATPPVEMLADPRHGVRHATALRRSLEVTELCTVVHGPTSLKLGNALHDRAFEGLLEYAQQIGVAPRRLPRARLPAPRERDAPPRRRRCAASRSTAEAMRITICVENLCPVYPGRSSVCHDPLSVRDLSAGSTARPSAMLLDVGHANVVAGFMGVEMLDAARAGARARAALPRARQPRRAPRRRGTARRSIPSSSTSTCRRAPGPCRGTGSAPCCSRTTRR